MLVWTNEEGGDAGQVTTVTFEEQGGKTLLVLHELYPSKEALGAARASGVEAGTLETFEQLDEFVGPGRERGTVMKRFTRSILRAARSDEPQAH